ncbi:MAG: LysR family transcriptional regulator [Aquincola tertiaricarbonis]|uniref:LysR family transcriptional regulator n=1 Tax=Aquincola sp. J276 TaxID=2898432 RepID=UPI002151AB79|nr:LysR family transcriptional regulator [Aquincola sp. J276]MCR5867938.1 LysR family transcriptional regulator [Aquincola sp. J276]
MHINELDLNLLRVFDAVYRARSVSRAADLLGIAQPATSQALTRLRLLIKDPLFVRVAGGVAPTPRAQRLAHAVQSAIATLEAALNEENAFDPRAAQLTIRLHLSDIGEARFLPLLMSSLSEKAPGVRVESTPLAHADIPLALDSGVLDLAIGFLPSVHGTQRTDLLNDTYIVLLREGHPFVSGKRRRAAALEELAQLEYVAVRSHSETIRILQLLRLEDRVRLTAAHFLALPAIVRTTDLGVVMPRAIAAGFVASGGHTIIEPQLPLRKFTVSLHWSHRYENDPAHRWIRELVVELFRHKATDALTVS